MSLALNLETNKCLWRIEGVRICEPGYMRCLGISNELYYKVKNELVTKKKVLETEHGNFIRVKSWSEGRIKLFSILSE